MMSPDKSLLTKERLAKALEDANAPQEMVEKAKNGQYDDYESDSATPQLDLMHDCAIYGLHSLRKRVMEDEFAGTKEESDEWFKREGEDLIAKMSQHKPSPDEYLELAKKRALEYLDAGDPRQAFTSMLSDMKKNPDFENHAGNTIGIGFMMLPGWIDNSAEVRRWIVGYR